MNELQTKKRKLQDDEEKQLQESDDDDASSRTHKKGRVSWSQELHHRFIIAVNQLGGIDKAVPRKILELMKVENLTRENVSSHLQKYRLHLKKVAASASDNAFGSLATSSKNPASQNVDGLPSSGTHQFGQAQNFNSFNNNDQLNLESAIGEADFYFDEADFYFDDPVQMKLAVNQHGSPKSCVTNDVRPPKELVTASCSGSSQVSAEIAELRMELAATRYEHCKLKEMMVQQERLIQSILRYVCPMQQPEPAFNLC